MATRHRLDEISRYSTIVIVEGILDVIKTGPFATCLFTKALNNALKSKIIKGLQQYGNEAVAVVMLDPDQDEKEQKRGMPHHNETLAKVLDEYVKSFPVYLPSGSDPGSLTSAEIMEFIQAAAERKKVKLNLKRRF
jgi:hypothetical protein